MIRGEFARDQKAQPPLGWETQKTGRPDDVVDEGGLAGANHVVLRRLGLGAADVVQHRGLEERGLLRYEPHLGGRGGRGSAAQGRERAKGIPWGEACGGLRGGKHATRQYQ